MYKLLIAMSLVLTATPVMAEWVPIYQCVTVQRGNTTFTQCYYIWKEV